MLFSWFLVHWFIHFWCDFVNTLSVLCYLYIIDEELCVSVEAIQQTLSQNLYNAIWEVCSCVTVLSWQKYFSQSIRNSQWEHSWLPGACFQVPVFGLQPSWNQPAGLLGCTMQREGSANCAKGICPLFRASQLPRKALPKTFLNFIDNELHKQGFPEDIRRLTSPLLGQLLFSSLHCIIYPCPLPFPLSPPPPPPLRYTYSDLLSPVKPPEKCITDLFPNPGTCTLNEEPFHTGRAGAYLKGANGQLVSEWPPKGNVTSLAGPSE